MTLFSLISYSIICLALGASAFWLVQMALKRKGDELVKRAARRYLELTKSHPHCDCAACNFARAEIAKPEGT